MDTKDTKVTANRQKKIEIVAKLNEKISTAKALVFTNYQGLTHKQLEGLKKAIKPMQADFVVAKNSLVLRALEDNKIKIEGENQLEGPTGTLLIYDDVVGPLKALAKVIKELGIPNVKFGILDSKMFTGEQILKISTLPTRDVLLTQVAFTLKSPISSLHRALNWNIQKLVMTLGAVSKIKPAVAQPVAPAPVAQAEPVQETAVEETKPQETVVEPKEEVTESTPVEDNSTSEEVKN